MGNRSSSNQQVTTSSNNIEIPGEQKEETSSSSNDIEISGEQKEGEIKLDPLFNKNTIVLIFTHGGLYTQLIDDVRQINYFHVDKEIDNIYKFNMAPSCEISEVSDIDYSDIDTSKKPEKFLTNFKKKWTTDLTKCIDFINTEIRELQNKNININTTDNQGELSDFMTKIQEQIINFYQKNHPKFNSTTKQCYLNHFHKGEKVGNKFYSFNQDDNDYGPHVGSWNISFLNSRNEFEDLFKKVSLFYNKRYLHHQTNELTTSEITRYLASRGVKNILMFDFSCSSIEDDDPRVERLIKRTDTGYYGGSNKKKQKKTKKNKNPKIKNKKQKIKKTKNKKNKK
jgi:hypothetical protein